MPDSRSPVESKWSVTSLRSPTRISPEKALAIVELRRRRLTQARIAVSLAVLPSAWSKAPRQTALRTRHPAEHGE
jgi:hypothetical protein